MRKKLIALLLGLSLAACAIACSNGEVPSYGDEQSLFAPESQPEVGESSGQASESAKKEQASAEQSGEVSQENSSNQETSSDQAESQPSAETEKPNVEPEAGAQEPSDETEQPGVEPEAGAQGPSDETEAKEPSGEADKPSEENTKQEEEMEYSVVYDIPEGFDRMLDGVKYAKISEIYYPSTTVGKTRKANVIVPADYSEDKEYPVLYLLHGIGGDHKEWLGGAPIQIVTNMVQEGLAPEMIVVLPNVRARENDAANPSDIYTLEHYKAFDNFINELRDDLMPYIEENYSVKTGKENTAIAGLSMGGREALYIGFSMPETFGYIGGFEPAPGLLKYTNFGVTEDGLFSPESFVLPEESDNFVMIVKGKQDGVVGNFPVEYHETLENNEVEHVYYEIDGGHDFTVWKHGLYNFLRGAFK